MFEFVVRYWNDVDSKEDVGFGVVSGTSYTEAVKNLEEYYGETLISIFIYGTGDDEQVYEFQIHDKEGIFENLVPSLKEKYSCKN